MNDYKTIARKYVLCEEPFENVYEQGEFKGFALEMRVPNYRGLRLSLVGGIRILVDDIEYPQDSLRITSGGETYLFEELCTVAQGYWRFTEPIRVLVCCDKPLDKGVHKVEAYAAIRITYHNEVIYEGGSCELTIKE